eukprot:SM000184S03785  [mRNA]  locus=s184:218504:225291:- [translate_table: standard]
MHPECTKQDNDNLRQAFRALRTLGNVLRSLTLRNTHYILLFSTNTMASFKALESLSLVHSYAADSDIKVLATCCQRLTELRLSCAAVPILGTITGSGLQSLATLLPKLRTFHMADYKSITDNGIQQLATGCSLLQDVSIRGCSGLSLQSVHALGMGCIGLRRLRCERSWGDSWLENGSLHLSHLEMLQLSIPSGCGEGARITMATLALSCPRLHELYLEATSEVVIRPYLPESDPRTMPLVKLTMCGFYISAASFRNLLATCPALKALSLLRCKLVGAMGELPAKLSLRSLDCDCLTGQVRKFWDLGSWCPNLTSLHTSFSPLVSRAGGKASKLGISATEFWPSQTCRPLQALSILTCHSVLRDDSITLGKAKASPQLQEVRLSGCKSIDAEAIYGFLSSCPRLKLIRDKDNLRQAFQALRTLGNVLQSLTLSSTHYILLFTTNTMASFKALESLSLFASYASDSDIKVLATCCQHLTELKLSCAATSKATVTDAGLQSLATLLPKLRTFHVYLNCSITDVGIQQLATGCSLLQDVSISGCSKVSVQSVHAISRGCIGLRRLQCELERSWGDSWLENGSLHLSHLEMLRLDIPSDYGEDALTTLALLASSCPRLHELFLHATSEVVIRPDLLERDPSTLPLVKLGFSNFHINGASFRNLLAYCPALKTLSLLHCDLVGAMGELSAKLSLRSLECHYLTGQVRHFWDLGSWCPNLTSLHTSFLPLVSRAEGEEASELGISALEFRPSQTCRPLQALSILTCQRRRKRIFPSWQKGSKSCRCRPAWYQYFKARLDVARRLRVLAGDGPGTAPPPARLLL